MLGGVTGDRDALLAALLDERTATVHARRERLDARLQEISDARDGASGDDEHDPEGDTLARVWSYTAALRASCDDELDQIERARDAVATGTFGSCTVCDGFIPFSRLEALPFVRTCVVCAAEAERVRR